MSFTVKVCGLTCAEDTEVALEAGADLLGFVVHPESPRHCSDLRGASAPAGDRGVLVMVALTAEPLLRAAAAAGLTKVQPHVPLGRRADVLAKLAEAGLEVILPWADEPGQRYPGAGLPLWEPSPKLTGVAGGSGRTHAMAYPPPTRFLLAGGLGPENLRERYDHIPASALPRLAGFDAASRLERSPGRKDPAKVLTFLRTARDLERRHACHAALPRV